MATNRIESGTVVVLRSGGPEMTVSFVEYGEASVTWFDGKTKRESRFQLAALKVVSESDGKYA